MPGDWEGLGHNSLKVQHAYDTSPCSPGPPTTSTAIQASHVEHRGHRRHTFLRPLPLCNVAREGAPSLAIHSQGIPSSGFIQR